VIAGSLFLMSFYLVEQIRMENTPSALRWVGAGICAGLAIFTSMLPSLMIGVIFTYAFIITRYHAQQRTRSMVMLFLGGLIGLAPLAAHNWFYFGAPWTQANVAGGYRDTFFSPSWSLFLSHLTTYLGFGEISVWLYAPIAGLGSVYLFILLFEAGQASQAAHITPALMAMAVALVLHFGYVLNIETIGHCQYGPRYLLPAFPFMCAPLAFLKTSPFDKGLVRVVTLVSIVIGLMGAMGGTMNCDLRAWLPVKFAELYLDPWQEPLRGFHLTMAAGLVATLILIYLFTDRKNTKKETSARS
jgi:hypothetical protein